MQQAFWLAVLSLGVAGLLVAWLAPTWVQQLRPEPNVPRAVGHPVVVPEPYNLYGGSATCRECHPKEHELWQRSNHALAERVVALASDLPYFYPPRTIPHGKQTSGVLYQRQRFELTTRGAGGVTNVYPLERVIGVRPLQQYLTPSTGGRWQVTELAVELDKKEWFDVYGEEDRQPGEWGHWMGRGMTWNSMCAACHNTRVRKQYDATQDAYHTMLAERGVGCEACHGPMQDHAEWQRRRAGTGGPPDPTLRPLTAEQMLETCGSCHARRTELTGDFVPGERFSDHYGLVLPDDGQTYYPDGQVRDEDFEYAAFLGSRMHISGVKCGDCHEPHSGRVRAHDNSLCLRCHGGPVPPAPLIDAATHSHHRPGTKGDACIDCHMPQTVYMQRHWRHDHGMTIPDPLLTQQHGIPNACTRCHSDKSVDWSLRYADEWYGGKMERPYRQRARTLARAKAGMVEALPGLTNLVAKEPAGYWRAVATGFLKPWADRPEVSAVLFEAAADTNALVRVAAARTLEVLAATNHPEAGAALRRMLDDPVRAVRIESAWGLRASLDTQTTAGRDLLRFLEHNRDQPAGLLQLGIFHLDRNNPNRAIGLLETAVSWDEASAPLRLALAVAYSQIGRKEDALRQMLEGARLSPKEGDVHFRLALALDEAGRGKEALEALQKAVALDPRHARAWYNLGLALSQAGRLNEALVALDHAGELDRESAMVAYAHATVFARLGRYEEARTEAKRASDLNPEMRQAAELYRVISREMK